MFKVLLVFFYLKLKPDRSSYKRLFSRLFKAVIGMILKVYININVYNMYVVMVSVVALLVTGRRRVGSQS